MLIVAVVVVAVVVVAAVARVVTGSFVVRFVVLLLDVLPAKSVKVGVCGKLLYFETYDIVPYLRPMRRLFLL